MDVLIMGEGLDSQSLFFAILLSMPRFLGMALFIPFLKSPPLPPMVRNSIVFALGLTILPLILQQTSQPIGGFYLFALALKETLIGMVLGFIISLTFAIPQAVGDFIDNQRGASIASVFNPAIGDQASPIGLLLSQAFLVWFIAAGGMILFLQLAITSFVIFPPMSFFPQPSDHFWTDSAGAFSAYLRLALIIASPVILSMLVLEISLGLVSRFAPQLNVFFLSMSLKSIMAIIILLFYIGGLLDHVWREGLFFENGYQFLRNLISTGER